METGMPSPTMKVDRQTAIDAGIAMLSDLPLKRAAAIYQAIHTITSQQHNFSLVDILEPKTPGQVSRVLKNATPSQETKALDTRRKIWEMESEKYAPELRADDSRKESEERRKKNEVSQINARQILKSRTLPKDQDFKLTLRELSNLFDPVSGRIIIPANFDLSSSPFASFYNASHRIGALNLNKGRVELRGYTYYIAKEPVSIEEKFSIIGEDLINALDLVSQYAIRREEITNARDYLLYLGVLDLMKYHSITLFHALTYNEREMKFPQKSEEFYTYQQYRQQALRLMQKSTRLFYQTLFGADYDQDLGLEEMQQSIGSLIDYIHDSMLSEVGNSDKERAKLNARFRALEVNNSLIIALGTQEAVRKNPDIDMVIGIPSGGTEAAIVTQLMYQLKQNRSPQLLFLPVSVHSQIEKKVNDQDVAAFLAAYYPNLFVDKKILLVDDNSETAQTLDIATKALLSNQAASISVHLVDFSARRFVNPKNIGSEAVRTYYDSRVSPSTLGLTQLDENGQYIHNRERKKFTNVAKLQVKKALT